MHKLPNESTPDFLERQQQRLAVVMAKKARSTNPKKNPKARRRRGKLGVYIPYLIRNIKEFRSSCNAPKVEPKRGNFSQYIANTDLFRRAQVAKRNGGYHNFEKLNRGEDGTQKTGG